MYKYLVSCYYWPSANGRLRLKSLQVKTHQTAEKSLDYSEVVRLTSAPINASSIERRRAHRSKARCEAELTASLAILDFDAPPLEQPLVFFGRTTDLSTNGLAMVLPSTSIDERCCVSETRLQLSLHLPTGSVTLEVNPVRCEPLRDRDTALGYLVAAQILSIDDNRDEYDDYLRSITV
jgi:hypothetical protein